MSIIRKLSAAGLIIPLKWVPDNLVYEVQTGSVSYGASSGDSDTDIVGITMNPKVDFFPNQAGHIYGFGDAYVPFTTWQHHHVQHESNEYDLTVYGIAKWFTLLAENNPNMIDILFSPLHCVRVNSLIAQHIRRNRTLFLHKGSKHKFIGYAYAQLKKIEKKDKEGKRAAIIEKYGYDVKYAMHLVRLALQCEQILSEGDLDLMRNADLLKAIRSGAWTEDRVKKFFVDKEKYLEELYEKSELPHGPQIDRIKALLLECLEMHYGSLSADLVVEGRAEAKLEEIKRIISQ